MRNDKVKVAEIIKTIQMKKTVMMAVLLAGLTATAQKGERAHRDAMKDLTPEQVATLQTKKMTLALDLTEVQQQQIKAIQLENAEMRKAKMEERKAQKEEREAKKPTSEERYAMANARLDHQIAQKAEMKKILSEEQYTQWQRMQHRKGRHGYNRHGKDRNRSGKRK